MSETFQTPHAASLALIASGAGVLVAEDNGCHACGRDVMLRVG